MFNFSGKEAKKRKSTSPNALRYLLVALGDENDRFLFLHVRGGDVRTFVDQILDDVTFGGLVALQGHREMERGVPIVHRDAGDFHHLVSFQDDSDHVLLNVGDGVMEGGLPASSVLKMDTR